MRFYRVACSLAGAAFVCGVSPTPDPRLLEVTPLMEHQLPDGQGSTDWGTRFILPTLPPFTVLLDDPDYRTSLYELLLRGPRVPSVSNSMPVLRNPVQQSRGYAFPELNTRREDAHAVVGSSSVLVDTDSIQLNPGSVFPLEMDSETKKVCGECLRKVPLEGNLALACNQHAVHSCMKRLHEISQSKNKSLRCPLCA